MSKAEKWEKFLEMFGRECIRCVLDPPRDRSICSNCVSSGSMERAVDAIQKFEREYGKIRIWRHNGSICASIGGEK